MPGEKGLGAGRSVGLHDVPGGEWGNTSLGRLTYIAICIYIVYWN